MQSGASETEMSEQRFNIVSNGVIVGADRVKVISQLNKLFRIDEARANQLVDGRRRVLKRAVDWHTASVYRSKLQQMGVAVDINLHLTREIFHGSLRTVEQTEPVEVEQALPTPHEENKPEQIWNVDLTQTAPKLFSFPHKISVQNRSKKVVYTLHNMNPTLSKTAVYILTLFAALLTQNYLLLLLVFSASSNVITAFGIIFLIVAVLLFPPLFTCMRCFRLQGRSKDIICIEHPLINPLQRKFHLYSTDGDELAYVMQSSIKHNELHCYDTEGKELLSLERYVDIERIGRNVADEMRDNLAGFRVFEQILSAANYVNKKKQMDFFSDISCRNAMPYLVIKNAQGNTIGRLYNDKQHYIEWLPNAPDEVLAIATMVALIGFCGGS